MSLSTAQLLHLYQTLAAKAEAKHHGITRAEFLTLLDVADPSTLSEGEEKDFSRAKKTLRDAGLSLGHRTVEGTDYYYLEPRPNTLKTWDMGAEEYRLVASLCAAWYGTELDDSARRILRKLSVQVPGFATLAKQHTITEPLQRLHFTDDKFLEETFTAFARHSELDIRYRNGKGEDKKAMNLWIWGIAYRLGNYYVTAVRPDKIEPGQAPKAFVYRLPRWSWVSIGRAYRAAKAPLDFSVAQHLDAHLHGHESTIWVHHRTGHTPFEVASYGVTESAVQAICSDWVILPPAACSHPTEFQQGAYDAQKKLLEKLQAQQAAAPVAPALGKRDVRDRSDNIDELTDTLLGLYAINSMSVEAQGTTHENEDIPLKKVAARFGVENQDKMRKQLKKVLGGVDDYYRSELSDSAYYMGRHEQAPLSPLEDTGQSHVSNPDLSGTKVFLYPNTEYPASDIIFDGVNLSRVEIAMMLFSLSAARLLWAGDERVERIAQALRASYPALCEQMEGGLSFHPDLSLLQPSIDAVQQGGAWDITYGENDHRVIEPYALVFENNQFYVHAYYPDAPGENHWRNFRLSNVHWNSRLGAGSVHEHPNGDTPAVWGRSQALDPQNPSITVHVDDDLLETEPFNALIERLKKQSLESARTPGAISSAPKTFYRVHYYGGHDQLERDASAAAGVDSPWFSRMLRLLVEQEGAVQLLGPEHIRAGYEQRLEDLVQQLRAEL